MSEVTEGNAKTTAVGGRHMSAAGNSQRQQGGFHALAAALVVVLVFWWAALGLPHASADQLISNFHMSDRPHGPAYEFLFSVGLEFQNDLEQRVLSESFRQEFENHGISLSDDVTITTEVEGSQWRINDRHQTYIVIRGGEALNIYRPMTDFPDDISAVYVIFDYHEAQNQKIRVTVFTPWGDLLLDEAQTYNGSGTESFEIMAPAGGFARTDPGNPESTYVSKIEVPPYNPTSYFESIEWTVSAALTPTPTVTETPTATSSPTATPTAVPPTATMTDTPLPAVDTPTSTPKPTVTFTPPATATSVQATPTSPPPTSTSQPPSPTPLLPTATAVPAAAYPGTATPALPSPTATLEQPSPTATLEQPSPTSTPAPPTATPEKTAYVPPVGAGEGGVSPTATTGPPPTATWTATVHLQQPEASPTATFVPALVTGTADSSAPAQPGRSLPIATWLLGLVVGLVAFWLWQTRLHEMILRSNEGTSQQGNEMTRQ